MISAEIESHAFIWYKVTVIVAEAEIQVLAVGLTEVLLPKPEFRVLL